MTGDDDIVRSLRAFGIAVLEPLTPQQVQDANSWLLSRPVFADTHAPLYSKVPIAPREMVAHSECLCVRTRDALATPHIFERALSVGRIAAAYLERDPPTMYSVNCFWTRPGAAATRADIQEFHCDGDDERFVGMFVYLNDVPDDADGPHDLRGPDGIVRTILGPAGTVFMADTSHPHRGRKPTSHERSFFWFRFGVSDQPKINSDKIDPMSVEEFGPARYPADPGMREMIRLLVR